MVRPRRFSVVAVVTVALTASPVIAEQTEDGDDLPSLEETDRQLNNRLAWPYRTTSGLRRAAW